MTSRGFGVVDVDYAGSTWHGREYREQLKGAWGSSTSPTACSVARIACRDRAGRPDRWRSAAARRVIHHARRAGPRGHPVLRGRQPLAS
ncbi:hypothetical protein HBB16_03350 [Pseudonocardia sp. MCCB 268]|nr:hypothetical protein [Pseudonocardia cytotoxica]